jgi:hypothetical protein
VAGRAEALLAVVAVVEVVDRGDMRVVEVGLLT